MSALLTADEAASLDFPTPTPEGIAALTGAAIERASARVDGALAGGAGGEADVGAAFEALFGALDDAARELAVAFGRGGAFALVVADDDARAAAFAAIQRIEGWKASFAMREDLAAAIEAFAARSDLAGLDELQRRYVDRWRKDVRLGGGHLAPAERAEMARLTIRQLELQSAFAANLAKPPIITAGRDELDGLPEAVRTLATPDGADPDRVRLPVNGGTYVTIMERATNRAFRERAYRARVTEGVPANVAVLEELVEIRRRRATLLGYPSWAAYRVENLAAPDAAFAPGFIEDLASRLRPIAEREMAAMTALLRAQPGAEPDLTLEDWDWRYADAIQRDALGADPDRLSEFFELEEVLRALDELCGEVFGIGLEPRPERIGWADGVRGFDIVDRPSGRTLAHLFFDPWARDGKQVGAWVETLAPGGGRHGEARPPILELVINVSKPVGGPALLSAIDVETLFHEFGHAMNWAVGRDPFVTNRETWLRFDFIEGPSEFNGSWGLRPAVIARYARHHVTGDPIPADLVGAIQRAESLNVSIEMLRQLFMAHFDVLVHGPDPIALADAYDQGWALRGMPRADGIFHPAGISHIASGPYDAALYGYVWSRVIRDDLLARFRERGLLSPEVGARYRSTVLSALWIDDPVEAVNAFLGRPWSAEAFLRRASGGAG